MKTIALIASLSVLLSAADADNIGLNFKLLSYSDPTPIVQWKLMSLPPSSSNLVVSASGGIGNVPVICYSGPVYQLTVTNLGTNVLLIEASTNLVDWQPFPAPGFQLTIDTNTAPFLNVPEDKMLFFRGVLRVKP